MATGALINDDHSHQFLNAGGDGMSDEALGA